MTLNIYCFVSKHLLPDQKEYAFLEIIYWFFFIKQLDQKKIQTIPIFIKLFGMHHMY